FTTKDRFSSYRFGVPICAGHHSRGLLKLSCGYCAGEKTTAFDSPAPSSTACANSVFSILPWSIPFTGRSLAFFTSAVTVRWAALVLASPASESTVESTAACRSATGPLVVKYTSRHPPMFCWGGEGFQSAKVIARLFSGGPPPCPPSTFFRGLTPAVTLNS